LLKTIFVFRILCFFGSVAEFTLVGFVFGWTCFPILFFHLCWLLRPGFTAFFTLYFEDLFKDFRFLFAIKYFSNFQHLA
jgi:hypothetical protein